MTITKDDYKLRHGRWADVYTHVLPDGTNMTIGVRDLLDAIVKHNIRAELVNVDPKQANRFISAGSIDLKRIDELAELMTKTNKMFPPILTCIWQDDGTAFICDGHHRFVLAYCLGMKHISAFICYPAMWQQYVITDMEPLTREQLFSTVHPSQIPSPWKKEQ